MAGGSTRKDAAYVDKRMNAVWGLSVKKKDAAIHGQGGGGEERRIQATEIVGQTSLCWQHIYYCGLKGNN